MGRVTSRDLAITGVCVWSIMVKLLYGSSVESSNLPSWLSRAQSLMEDRLSVIDTEALGLPVITSIYYDILRDVIAERYGGDGLSLYSVIARREATGGELLSHIEQLIDKGARLLGVPENHLVLGLVGGEAVRAAEIVLYKCMSLK